MRTIFLIFSSVWAFYFCLSFSIPFFLFLFYSKRDRERVYLCVCLRSKFEKNENRMKNSTRKTFYFAVNTRWHRKLQQTFLFAFFVYTYQYSFFFFSYFPHTYVITNVNIIFIFSRSFSFVSFPKRWITYMHSMRQSISLSPATGIASTEETTFWVGFSTLSSSYLNYTVLTSFVSVFGIFMRHTFGAENRKKFFFHKLYNLQCSKYVTYIYRHSIVYILCICCCCYFLTDFIFIAYDFFFVRCSCSGCDTLFPSLMLLEHHKEEFEHWSDEDDDDRLPPCCRRNRDEYTDTDSFTSEAESEDLERLL